jgi:hypothetical protein
MWKVKTDKEKVCEKAKKMPGWRVVVRNGEQAGGSSGTWRDVRCEMGLRFE